MNKNFYYNEKLNNFLDSINETGLNFTLNSLNKNSGFSLTSFRNWRNKIKKMRPASCEFFFINLKNLFSKEIARTKKHLALLEQAKSLCLTELEEFNDV